MAKPKTSGTNKTYEKLKGLPFENAGELKQAQDEITRAVWSRLEYAKVLNELTNREEFKFWRKEFESGLACGYGGDPTQLVKVFSDGNGIKVDINKDLSTQSPASEAVLGVLVKALSESFATTYYKAKGILPCDSDLVSEQAKRKNKTS